MQEDDARDVRPDEGDSPDVRDDDGTSAWAAGAARQQDSGVSGYREDDEDDDAGRVHGTGPEGSEVSADRPPRQLATHEFVGWENIRSKLVPPAGRRTLAPDLFGVSTAAHGFWRDVRMTSLCGSGKHDLLYMDPYEINMDTAMAEAEKTGEDLNDVLDKMGVVRGEGRELMPPGVRQERAALWFDLRERDASTGEFLAGRPRLTPCKSAVTRPGLPRGSMVMNIASCLRRHGGRGLLDLAFSQAHGCDQALAKRALATATMISAMCQPMEMGWQSGDHAELQAWRDEQRAREESEEARAADDAQAGDDGSSVSGGGARKRQKKEAKEPEIRRYTYFCKGRAQASNSIEHTETDGMRPKFKYVLERLVDEESEHLTHGHRLHIVVYDPKFSNTQLLARLMETARKVT